MGLRAAKAPAGPLRRATVAVVASRRLPCGARVAGLPQNSLRSLRSLRSNSCGKSVHEARLSFGRRAAGDTPLLGATEARRSGPASTFAGYVVPVSPNIQRLKRWARGTGAPVFRSTPPPSAARKPA